MEEAFAQKHADMKAGVFITAEGSVEDNWYLKYWSDIWDFTYRLKSRKYPSLRFHTEVYAGETHAQAQPRSFMAGLKFLFTP